MTKPKLPKEFVKRCKQVTAKRAKTVIDHILKHGFITTEELKDKYGPRCSIYLETCEARDLQVDHRIPFEVIGDLAGGKLAPDGFMLLCGSANRAKSWSCEHCANWLEQKSVDICRNCYWAYPDDYTHIAMRTARRIDIMWTGAEVDVYDRLKKKTEELQQDMPAYVKKIIEKNF